VRKVAERATPFTSTPRYFRGRAVAVLRDLQAGVWLPLSELGPRIKPDWSDADSEWLSALLRGLAADGLVELDTELQQVRLP
jgi:A/G-specific adenine glycosylase